MEADGGQRAAQAAAALPSLLRHMLLYMCTQMCYKTAALLFTGVFSDHL